MNKKTLAHVLSRRNNIPFEQAYNNVDAILDIIATSINEGISVKLRGFGTFTMRERKSRLMSDGAGNKRHVQGSVRPHFRPSHHMRRRLRNSM